MNDQDVLGRINELVDEEQHLLERHSAQPLPEDERKRLEDVQVQLDQCWDLLRQRRARREFGEDPSAAKPRDPKTVERYLQ